MSGTVNPSALTIRVSNKKEGAISDAFWSPLTIHHFNVLALAWTY